jgi:hypothetical protein
MRISGTETLLSKLFTRRNGAEFQIPPRIQSAGKASEGADPAYRREL